MTTKHRLFIALAMVALTIALGVILAAGAWAIAGSAVIVFAIICLVPEQSLEVRAPGDEDWLLRHVGDTTKGAGQ